MTNLVKYRSMSGNFLVFLCVLKFHYSEKKQASFRRVDRKFLPHSVMKHWDDLSLMNSTWVKVITEFLGSKLSWVYSYTTSFSYLLYFNVEIKNKIELILEKIETSCNDNINQGKVVLFKFIRGRVLDTVF